MKTKNVLRSVAIVSVCAMIVSVCGGCTGLKWHPVYKAALVGTVVGVIVGHQYGEDCQGAAIGAAVGATGCFLEQVDELAAAEEIVVEVAGENGSVTHVILEKKEGIYICPNGEFYNHIPSNEELIAVYGL